MGTDAGTWRMYAPESKSPMFQYLMGVPHADLEIWRAGQHGQPGPGCNNGTGIGTLSSLAICKTGGGLAISGGYTARFA